HPGAGGGAGRTRRGGAGPWRGVAGAVRAGLGPGGGVPPGAVGGPAAPPAVSECGLRREPAMSGHSKWATIKHRKGAVDKARGKLFAKLIRQVEVAAREGGSDMDSNATLRTMYQKARDASVPTDTIERAVKRGTGELEGVNYEQV